MRECESQSKSCGVTTASRFILTRKARTPARTSARTCRNGCKRSKETFEEMRLQGRRPSAKSPSVSITGLKQLPETFLSRFGSRFFSRILYYRRERDGGERGGQFLASATRVSYHGFLVALVRAHICETDKEDGVDTKRKRRRRRRRLQSGFNETSWGQTGSASSLRSPHRPLSLLVRRIGERRWSREVCRPLSVFVLHHLPLSSNRDAYLK